MQRAGEPQPALQLLIYPAVDVASETASMTTYADAYPLSRPIMEWFMGHYMGPEADPADPRLSPNKTEDLSGLAPAVAWALSSGAISAFTSSTRDCSLSTSTTAGSALIASTSREGSPPGASRALAAAKNSRVNSDATPAIHGFDGSETMTSYCVVDSSRCDRPSPTMSCVRGSLHC